MLDGTYELLVNTPFGDKQGTAVLGTEGSVLTVDVKIHGFPRQKGKGTCDGDSFSAKGSVRIPFMRTYQYVLRGSVQEDLLDAMLTSNIGTFRIAGIRK